MNAKKVAIYGVLAGSAAGLSLIQILHNLPLQPVPPPVVKTTVPVLEHPDYRLVDAKPTFGLKP